MYRFAEHTSELELELESDTVEGVFQEATRAFGDLVGVGTGEPVERAISLRASDPGALLAAWLDELVFLADSESVVPEAATIHIDGSALSGTLRGRRGTPRPIVKGVTLHRLCLRPENGGWSGRVVLDV